MWIADSIDNIVIQPSNIICTINTDNIFSDVSVTKKEQIGIMTEKENVTVYIVANIHNEEVHLFGIVGNEKGPMRICSCKINTNDKKYIIKKLRSIV